MRRDGPVPPGPRDRLCRTCQTAQVRSYGAPASNVRQLQTLGLRVEYSQTDLSGVEAILLEGDPVIVFVRTGELPYWSHATDHAVVVVGWDETRLYVNDPARDEPSIAVGRDEFELAWLERDYFYARIMTRNT